MSEKLDLFVAPDGTVTTIYDDLLVDVFAAALGTTETKRASHVEPNPIGEGWLADMRPVHGPILGADGTSYLPINMPVGYETKLPVDQLGPVERNMLAHSVKPFRTRQAALDAEREWLDERLRAGAL